MAKTACALLVCALAAISCGGSSDDASAKCEALESKLCMRFAMCSNDAQPQEMCVATLDLTLKCASAGVTSNYQACLDALETVSCAELTGGRGVNLPPACSGAIVPGS